MCLFEKCIERAQGNIFQVKITFKLESQLNIGAEIVKMLELNL